MDHYSHHPLPLMVGQGVSLHFCLFLSKFQSFVSYFLVKEFAEGLAILGGVLDIIMNPAKQGILPFFFRWWLGHGEWSNHSVPNPFVQDVV